MKTSLKEYTVGKKPPVGLWSQNVKRRFNLLENRYTLPLLIILIALTLRCVLFAGKDTATIIGADGGEYLALATSLLNGDGFCLKDHIPSARRPPLYPMFLAAVLSFPGASLKTVLGLQMIIDAFIPLILFFLARNLLDKTHGVISGLMLSLYLPSAAMSLAIQSETLFTFFLILSLIPLTLRIQKWWHFGAAGILLAAATLIRPNGLIVAFFMGLWLLYRFHFRRFLSGAAIFFIAYTLFLSPWVIRNYNRFGHFIPISTITGAVLYNSYIIPEKGLGYCGIKQEHAEYLTMNNEVDKNRYFTQVTFQYIKDHPMEALKLIPLKLSLLIYPFDLKWLWPGAPFRYNFFWGTALSLTLAAFFFQPKILFDRLSILLFPLIALVLMSIVFLGLPRYRAPFDPLILVIASVGLGWMWQHSKRHLWIGMLLLFNIAILFMGESSQLKLWLQHLKPW